jgi:hypothetical protein
MYVIDWGLADEFGFMASGTRSFFDEAKRGVAELRRSRRETRRELERGFFHRQGAKEDKSLRTRTKGVFGFTAKAQRSGRDAKEDEEDFFTAKREKGPRFEELG